MTDIIQRHSKRVNQIIENTLQLSRRSEPEIEPIQLKPWLESVIAEYQMQQAAPQSIRLVVERDNTIAQFDPDQVEQVLVNLIDNGLRHGLKQNLEAVLEIRLAKADGKDQSFIEVIDQGAGIDDNNIHHLFEPFFTTESQGTGLGLYLSREICEANQAQLDYVSNQGNDTTVGACFRITFAHHKRIV
jgi:two-component system sensor histidine kinase PilS (NtrC family)